MNTRVRASVLTAFAAVSELLLATISQAGTPYYWDNNGAEAGFGTAGGIWGQNGFWSPDSTGLTDPSKVATASTENLFLGTDSDGLAAGTLEVSGTNEFGSLTFGAASGAITLTNGALNLSAVQTPFIFVSATNRIASALTGTGGARFACDTHPQVPRVVTLSGANDFTGSLTITTNVDLRLENGGVFGGGAYTGTFTNSGALTLNGAGMQKLGSVWGTGSLSVRDSVLTLAGTTTVGVVAGAGSVVTAAVEKSLPPSGTILVKDGGRLVLNATVSSGEQGNGISGGNSYSVGTNGVLDVLGGFNIGFGNSQWVYVDSGALNLYANQYLNRLDLRNGACVSNANKFIYAVYYRGGNYTVSGTSPSYFKGGYTLRSGTLTLDVADVTGDSAADFLVSGPIGQATPSGWAAPVTLKTGAGTVAFAGTNTCINTTLSISAGTVRLDTDGALNAGNRLVLSGGALTIGATSNRVGSLTLTSSSVIAIAEGGKLLFANSSTNAWTAGATLSITGSLAAESVRFGTNATALTTAQADAILLNGKHVEIQADGTFALQTARTLYYDTNGEEPGFGTAGGTWGRDTFWSADPLGTSVPAVTQTTLIDILSFGTDANGLAAGSIGLEGTNRLAALTFGAASGELTLRNGTLLLDAATTPFTIQNKGTNRFASALVGAGGAAFAATTNAWTTVEGSASAWMPALELAGTNTFTGGLSVSNLALRVTDGGVLGGGAYAGAISLTNQAELVFDGAGAQTLSGPIVGTAASGKGVWGVNGLTVLNGSLKLSNATNNVRVIAGEGSVVTAAVVGAVPSTGLILAKDGGRLVFTATGNSNQDNGISNGNDYHVSTNGILDVRGYWNLGFNWNQTLYVDSGEVNLYADQVIANLDLRNGAHIRNYGAWVYPCFYRGGTWTVAGSIPSSYEGGYILGSATNTLNVADVTGDDAPDFFISGPVTRWIYGSWYPYIQKTGEGTVAFATTNTAAAFTFIINKGTVRLDANTVFNANTLLTLNGGTLALNGTSNTVGTLTLRADSVINLGNAGTVRFADSHTNTWTGNSRLTFAGTFRDKAVRVGTNKLGLTSAQLESIRHSGSGRVKIDSNGYLLNRPDDGTLLTLGN